MLSLSLCLLTSKLFIPFLRKYFSCCILHLVFFTFFISIFLFLSILLKNFPKLDNNIFLLNFSVLLSVSIFGIFFLFFILSCIQECNNLSLVSIIFFFSKFSNLFCPVLYLFLYIFIPFCFSVA